MTCQGHPGPCDLDLATWLHGALTMASAPWSGDQVRSPHLGRKEGGRYSEVEA